MSDIVISVQDVSKCYRVFDNQRSRLLHALSPRHTEGMQEIWALKDINLEVRRGESLGVIGRNGSGKSTLLQMVCGTLNPSSGNIQTHGRIAAGCPANFVLWPLGDVAELAYWLGQRPACSVVRQGRLAVDGMGLQHMDPLPEHSPLSPHQA